MPKRFIRCLILPWASLWILLCVPQHAFAAVNGYDGFLKSVVVVDIRAQGVATAMLELSKQARVQVLMPGGSLDSYNASALKGRMPLHAALDRLLHGTRHRFRVSGDRVLTIESEAAAAKR